MLALTVRQPWAWAIFHAGKDVENRTWPTKHRGLLAIHAATKIDEAAEPFMSQLGFTPPNAAHLDLGCVVGTVVLVDCVHDDNPSVWAENGLWHWVLHSPHRIAPVRWRGKPGLFDIPTTRLEQ